MKGLILVYIATFAGSIAALRYPLIGLQVYVGFAVLRPQAIFGFAGDLSNLSFVVGVAVLIGWALKGCGSWRLGRGWPVVLWFVMFLLWFLISASQAIEPDQAFSSAKELSKLVIPFFVGVTLMEGEKDWRPLLWTIVLAQGYVGFEQNINYLVKGFNTAGEGFGGMDNNCFGVSLVTVLGPAVALTVSSKTWSLRCLAGVAAAMILHTTFLTFSRGAMLGLIAMAVVAFVMMPKRPKYLGALVLALLFAARFIGPQLAERYTTYFCLRRREGWLGGKPHRSVEVDVSKSSSSTRYSASARPTGGSSRRAMDGRRANPPTASGWRPLPKPAFQAPCS